MTWYSINYHTRKLYLRLDTNIQSTTDDISDMSTAHISYLIKLLCGIYEISIPVTSLLFSTFLYDTLDRRFFLAATRYVLSN